MKRCLMLAMLMLAPHVGFAEEDAFLRQSIARLSQLTGFHCRFEQQIYFADQGVQRYSGELAVRRPGMFRWQYLQPYEQLYVGDGEGIWHYEPDLMQAERLDGLDAVDPVVMRLLDGRVPMQEIHVLGKRDGEQGERIYQIKISSSPPVWLAFAPDGRLRSVERDDMLGNINRIDLTDCVYVAPGRNLFSFSPPAGVEVVDMRSRPKP